MENPAAGLGPPQPNPAERPTAQSIVAGLVARGLPLHVAQGFAGNMQVETAGGFDPGINEIKPKVAGSRGGFGLYQLTGPRRRAFEAYAKTQGVDPANADAQLDYLVQELNTTERGPATFILQSQDAAEATRRISDRFLRPGIPHMEARLSVTKSISGADQGPTKQTTNDISPGLSPSVASAPLDYVPEETPNDLIARALNMRGSVEPSFSGALDNPVATADQMLRMGLEEQRGPAKFAGGEAPSFLGGFLKTMLHGGTGGLIGRDPYEAFYDPEAVGRFAQDSPWSSLAAEVLGSAWAYAVPLAGGGASVGIGMRATKLLPGLSRAAAFATSPVGSRAYPIGTAAVRAMLPFVPLEIARVAGAAIDLEQPGTVPKVLGQIAMEMPVFALFGGAEKALRASSTFRGRVVGKEIEIQKGFDFYNTNGSLQERLRQTARAREILRESAGFAPDANLLLEPPGRVPAAVGEFDDLIAGVQTDLRAAIAAAVPPKPNAYIKALVGLGGKAVAGKLSKILKLGDGEGADSSLLVRKFVVGEGGYKQTELLDLQRDLRAAGITEDSMAYVQHPRIIETLDDVGVSKMKNLLGQPEFARMSKNINEATYIASEPDGGMIMVRRIKNAENFAKKLDPKKFKSKAAYEKALAAATAKGRGGSKFVVFRTDAPLKFEPRAERFQKALMNIYKPLRPMPRNPQERGVPMFEILKKLNLEIPKPESLLGVPARHLTKYLDGRLSPELKETARLIGRRVDHLASTVKGVVAPGIMVLTQNKRAQRLWSIARAAHNQVNFMIETEWFGTKLPSRAKTLFGSLFEVPEFKNSPAQLLKVLDESEMGQLSQVFLNRLSIQDAKKLNFSEKVIGFLRVVQKNDEKRTAEAVAIQSYAKELGFDIENDFIPLANHYGLVRSWVGNFRHAVLNEKQEVVGYGSGHTALDATADARKVVARAEQQGSSRVLFIDRKAELSSREEDLLLASHLDKKVRGQDEFQRARASLSITPPASQQKSKGMLGGAGASDVISKKEVQDIILSNIASTRKNNLNIAMRIDQLEEFAKLRAEEPALYLELIRRMNLRAGITSQSGISAKVNKGVDAILGPYLGKNSATKIVNTINQGLYTLTLGAFDMGFAAVNLITPIITSMPEIAFLQSAPPAQIARYYSSLSGLTRSGVSTMFSLNPLKMLTAGVRDLYRVKPGTENWEFFMRAVNERIIDPKFIEEFTGQSSAKIYGAGATEGGWAEWLFRLSNFPAAKSEELSRGTSFMMGLNAGKDLYGLEGERLYQFAREFTERTQFLYTAADRPAILTGPLGQAFGLFKNWGMHHMGLLAAYHGEAFLSRNFAPLLWTAVGTGAVGGVGAMPWLGVADKFSRAASDTGLQENLYDALGYNESTPQAYAADMLWYGFPATWGLSLQGRATAVSNNPIHDVSMLTSLVAMDRIRWAGDFLGSAMEHAEVTRTPLAGSRELLDKFVRATAPRSVYRFFSVNAEGQLRSLKTQGQLVSNISVPDHLAYAMGLNPLEVEKFFAVDSQAWMSQEARRGVIDALGSQMSQAMEMRDVGAQRFIMGKAAREGVTDSVLNSAAHRMTDHRRPRSEREWKDHVNQQTAKAIGVPTGR